MAGQGALLDLRHFYLTKHYVAHTGRAEPDKTVTVIAKGTVGLSDVLACRIMRT
ncbi:hypothetical protein [Streptomyces niveus]|uniref:hypothetical protein n=1 Tax=Streptomyces niveus TaxID=193462 RepID=UPI001495A034|nr:hypothetical protein [Streptomyces niveus]